MKKIMMAKKGLSEMSRDSAIAGCDDEDLAENYENGDNFQFHGNLSNYSWSRNSSKDNLFSLNSSISSICSCMSCAAQGNTEWKRRPSRLLEGYDVEDFYKFDEILGM